MCDYEVLRYTVCRVLQLRLKGLITREKKGEGELKLEGGSIVKLRSTMAMLIKTPPREAGRKEMT